MMRRVLAILALALAAGCATNLQKGDRMLAMGRFADARRFYQMELDQQRKLAELPRWTGREYQYQFSPREAAQAILGVGRTFEKQGQPDPALYHYSYFTQFALRHGLDAGREIQAIEQWIRESGRTAPKTESDEIGVQVLSEPGKPAAPPVPAPAPARKAGAPAAAKPPSAPRTAPAPAATAPTQAPKPAKTTEQSEDEGDVIYW